MIYVELEKKSLKSMWKVMLYGTIGATVGYILAGVFGYVTFSAYADVDHIMKVQNILKAPYGDNPFNYISLFGILVVILFATPLTILPCKDSVEDVFLKPGERLNDKQNIIVTFILVAVSFGFAIVIPNIGDAMTILGATTNTGIGFLLPIIYYLKVERKAPRFAPQKIVAYLVFVLMLACSIIELVTFIYKKTHGED